MAWGEPPWLVMATLYVAFLTVALFAREDKFRADAWSGTLPVTRLQLVRGSTRTRVNHQESNRYLPFQFIVHTGHGTAIQKRRQTRRNRPRHRAES